VKPGKAGRQQALDHEQLEERARRVHPHASAIASAVQQLQKQTLAPEQRAIVDALAAASVKLGEVAATLPPPRARRSSASH
jgi:hypothetical protein